MSMDWLRCALGLVGTQTPFPWQIELLRRFRQGEEVSSLDIPTGLGKTAVMAVWLVARALGAALPRRLVYVVDRRAVVDQATEVAELLCAWVANDRSVAQALGLDDRPLPISTLRGQHVDNRAWLEDPSSPAIIVGTVDMVGSRLLFSGYGVSWKMRPYHAGLLGADTLVVLDEAHLVPAFEDLLRQIERGAVLFGPKEPSLRTLIPPFRLLTLSATGRQTDATTLTLSDDDRKHPIVNKRLNAKKSLTIVELANVAEDAATSDEGKPSDEAEEPEEATKKTKGAKLAKVLAEQAWKLTEQGSAKVRCLVFCDRREDATAVAKELRSLARTSNAPEPTIELFVGGRRVKERTEARQALARLGFIADTAVNLERAAFLIATSAGEVGVDLDADHMVCDLVAWERMVQRLGRVNRRGDGDAKVIVVVGPEPAPDSKKAKEALESKLAKRDAALAALKERPRLKSELEQLEAAKPPDDQEVSVLRNRVKELDERIASIKTETRALPKKKESTPQDTERKKALQNEKKHLDEDKKTAKEQLRAAEKAIKERQKLQMEGRIASLQSELKKCNDQIKAFKDSDAKAVALYEAEVACYRALRRLLDAITEDGGSLSPDALVKLRARQDLADALRDATTIEPLRPELTRSLVDAWSMTSLDEHPGRPEVDPWLRGFRPNEPPQTTVVWRRYLPVRADGSFDAKAAQHFFEAAPPHTSEHLETETYVVRDWLIQRARKVIRTQGSHIEESVVAVGISNRGEIERWWTLGSLANLSGDEAKKFEGSLPGLTLVVDARLGGLIDGLLSKDDDPSLVDAIKAAEKALDAATRSAARLKEAAEKAESAARDAAEKLVVARERASAPKARQGAQDALNRAEEKLRLAAEAAIEARGKAADAEKERMAAEAARVAAEQALVQSCAAAADDGSTPWLARPNRADVPVTGFRIRALTANDEDDPEWRTTPGTGWVRRYLFVTNMVDGEPSAALAIDGWAGDAATEEERAQAGHHQQLDEHQSWAEECARQIAQRLGIDKDPRTKLLVLAARLHDEGKRAVRWQRAFKAPTDGRLYAKTRGPIDFDLLDGYRHELGSLGWIEAHDDFKALGPDDRDFVLHLVAAHHGFARPVIGTSGCDDAPPSIVEERARAVALRFARLTNRWGPWGLAWWESLLRSADQSASRRNQQTMTAQEVQSP